MANQQQHTKDVLASRFVERALSYSWIKFGWDTASKTYETVKQSTSLTKVHPSLQPPFASALIHLPLFLSCWPQYGCELVEGNLSKVVHSPIAEGTVSLFAPLIVIADEFSVRQLDKVWLTIPFTYVFFTFHFICPWLGFLVSLLRHWLQQFNSLC
jgi:hypothetical protein